MSASIKTPKHPGNIPASGTKMVSGRYDTDYNRRPGDFEDQYENDIDDGSPIGSTWTASEHPAKYAIGKAKHLIQESRKIDGFKR